MNAEKPLKTQTSPQMKQVNTDKNQELNRTLSSLRASRRTRRSNMGMRIGFSGFSAAKD